MKTTIAILGLGKAGGSLLASARAARISVVGKAARVPQLARTLPWRRAGTLFLAVPDDFIERAAELLADDALARDKKLPPLVVHMSGAKGASVLEPLRARGCEVGTFHPLASLDGVRAIPRHTFIALDPASPADATRTLTALAKRMHLVPGAIDERDRVRYHTGAAVAGNLATALLREGTELLVRSGVEREVARESLARLLVSTAEAAIARPLRQSLTGPVARADIATIEGHLALLDREDPALASLYRALSRGLVAVSGHTNDVRARLLALLR